MFQCVKDQEEGDDFKVRVRWLCQVPKGVSSGEGAVGRAAGGQQGCRIGSGPHVLGCWVLASLPGILALTFTLAFAFSCPNFCSLFLPFTLYYLKELCNFFFLSSASYTPFERHLS